MKTVHKTMIYSLRCPECDLAVSEKDLEEGIILNLLGRESVMVCPACGEGFKFEFELEGE